MNLMENALELYRDEPEDQQNARRLAWLVANMLLTPYQRHVLQRVGTGQYPAGNDDQAWSAAADLTVMGLIQDPTQEPGSDDDPICFTDLQLTDIGVLVAVMDDSRHDH